MIITEKILIKRKGNSNLEYYKNIGYDVREDFIIDISHLSNGSSINIDVDCDDCNSNKTLSYKDYNRFNDYPGYICPNCKRERTNLDKFGVSYVSQLEESKEKVKKTNLLRYGVESPAQSDMIKEKIEKTNLEKYGVKNVFQSEEIKDKIKQTNLNNWSVEYYQSTDHYKEKVKNTNLERYGVEYYTKTDDYKEKSKKTYLENHGVDNHMKLNYFKNKVKNTFFEKYGGFTLESEYLKDKIKQTNLERYDVEYYQSTEQYKEKVKKTNLERYGVEYYTKTDDYKEKSKKTNLKNCGVDHIYLSEIFRKEHFKIDNHTSHIKYLSNGISLFRCENGHDFEISCGNFTDRKNHNLPLCTICYPIGDQKSIKEKELCKFISSIYVGEIISSYRDGFEIDIYLPDLKLGFEFNGLYYHSDKFKNRNYHLNKTNYFKERGIRIIHIWEDDWTFNQEIIKSQIRNCVGLTKDIIFARKCTIKEVDIKESRQFLDKNHLQGFVGSSLKIGIFYKEELVSLMTFDNSEGRNKMEDGGWNLNRFCNKLNYNVIGGASKLLKHFIKNYNVNRIVSYADKDWSIGGLYYKLGFENISESKPDYKYIVGGKRVHKSRYKKDNLNLEDKTKVTESKVMSEKGISKIYDCGKIKFEK